MTLLAISDEFLAPLATVKWILTLYVLFWMILIFPGGIASDRFGPQKLTIVGILLFAFASYLAAQTQKIEAVIAYRAIQGIGSALFVPAMYVMIAQSFSDNQRGLAIGIVSIGVGSVLHWDLLWEDFY